MPTPEWYQPTKEGVSPFDSSYMEEFRLPPERTEQELKSLEAIISAIPKKPRVLDIAGGFGRISSELIRRGLVKSLVDLDLNGNFLQLAKKGGITEAVQGDMRDLGFQGVLDCGGVLVLDLPNYNRISSNFSIGREMPLNNGSVIRYQKRIEGQHLIEERFRVKDGQILENLLPIKLRIYPPEEIVKLCRKAGFEGAELFDQELKEFSPPSSQRLWVVSKK